MAPVMARWAHTPTQRLTPWGPGLSGMGQAWSSPRGQLGEMVAPPRRGSGAAVALKPGGACGVRGLGGNCQELGPLPAQSLDTAEGGVPAARSRRVWPSAGRGPGGHRAAPGGPLPALSPPSSLHLLPSIRPSASPP